MSQGKTFSIWHLNDLRDLTRHVSLFLFGDVHRQLWKTAQGSVVGLLNANPMKPRDGSEEVSSVAGSVGRTTLGSRGSSPLHTPGDSLHPSV